MQRVLVFSINNQFFAIDLPVVKFVIKAASVIPTQSSDDFLGLVRIGKTLIPVLDMRNYLGMENRDLELNDQFIICEINGQNLALWIDRAIEVYDCDETSFSKVPTHLQKEKIFSAVLNQNNQTILILNIDSLQCKYLTTH